MKTWLTLALLATACAEGRIDALPDRDAPGAAGRAAMPDVAPARPGAPIATAPPTPVFEEDPTPVAAPGPERCDKVDFLYVVDNSASMTDKQASLARSFAGFSRILGDTLGAIDHQIMVIDTDDRNAGDVIHARHQLEEPEDDCDGMLGAGLRMDENGELCGTGRRRFLLGNQSRTADAFACLAHVGTLGDAIERPIDALLAATGASKSSAASACNAGFLRDDALLVVTLITDEEDDSSAGDPAAWKRALSSAKGGDEGSIVMLGLLGDLQVPGGLPGGPCDELSGAAAPRLQEFVESFELGSLGSVCADDYSGFFASAVSVIDTACEAFEPTLH